ncbi:hypothetical protein MC28_1705 [Bacillus thuringiensis MC28]|jgi:hypothetical protein|nr:hypothetical protein MC28_1705 [Bacillus thuringiensis MC28]
MFYRLIDSVSNEIVPHLQKELTLLLNCIQKRNPYSKDSLAENNKNINNKVKR